jgi:hypothetical protein
MHKILSLLIVGLFLVSGLTTIGLSLEADVKEQIIHLQFLKPEMTESESYIQLHVEGANTHLSHGGNPLLPLYATTLTFPFGTNIIDISYDTYIIKSMVLSEKIKPAPTPQIRNSPPQNTIETKEGTIYQTTTFFPESWISYFTGGGRDKNNEHKIFLTLQVFPIRYCPATDTIEYIEDIKVTITYREPMIDPFPKTGEYDLVIITPLRFADIMQKLVDHKNAHDVPTKLMTLQDIYFQYGGVDKPEQIKYFIKDALDTWYIKYVLLVGGMKSVLCGTPRDDRNQGTKDWHFPVRYTNLIDGEIKFDPGFISDLYYADIYDGDGKFSSWDGNGDGVFGGWDIPRTEKLPPGSGSIDKDIIDLFTDVSVGRLACRNRYEARTMVDKIIAYESTPADPTWFNRMVVVAGDPYPDNVTNFYEGELIADKALSLMPSFEPIRLFASNRDIAPDYTPHKSNIIREFSRGCGHVLFDGHATPAFWTTCWPGGEQVLPPCGWFRIRNFPRLRNEEKLPICVVGGCHSSMFNVTLFFTMTDIFNKKFMWSWGRPIPECWSWVLTRKANGGAIATIGCTGLGYEQEGENGDLDGDGVNEPDCVEKLGGYQERLFYQNIHDGVDVVGDAWEHAINDYLSTFPGMEDQWDAKVVEQWVLLGDPSLKIGGYQ